MSTKILGKKQLKRVEAALPDIQSDYAIPVELPYEWAAEWAAKPRKESPSSVVRFLSCPLRWYIDRYSPLEDSEEINVYALAGNIAHRILEVYYSEPADKRTYKLLRTVSTVMWDAIKDDNDEDGIISRDLLDNWKSAMDASKNPGSTGGFIRKITNKAVNNIFEFDERPKELNIVSNETWLRMMINNTRINGRADRVIRNRSGKLMIDDFKTGQVYNDVDEKIDILDHNFIPAGMYALMMMQMKENDLLPPEIESVRLIYLTHLTEFEIPVTPKNMAVIETLIDRVTTMMNGMIANGVVYATPSEKKSKGICSHCPIVKMCPAWTDNTNLDAVQEHWGV